MVLTPFKIFKQTQEIRSGKRKTCNILSRICWLWQPIKLSVFVFQFTPKLAATIPKYKDNNYSTHSKRATGYQTQISPSRLQNKNNGRDSSRIHRDCRGKVQAAGCTDTGASRSSQCCRLSCRSRPTDECKLSLERRSLDAGPDMRGVKPTSTSVGLQLFFLMVLFKTKI